MWKEIVLAICLISAASANAIYNNGNAINKPSQFDEVALHESGAFDEISVALDILIYMAENLKDEKDHIESSVLNKIHELKALISPHLSSDIMVENLFNIRDIKVSPIDIVKRILKYVKDSMIEAEVPLKKFFKRQITTVEDQEIQNLLKDINESRQKTQKHGNFVTSILSKISKGTAKLKDLLESETAKTVYQIVCKLSDKYKPQKQSTGATDYNQNKQAAMKAKLCSEETYNKILELLHHGSNALTATEAILHPNNTI